MYFEFQKRHFEENWKTGFLQIIASVVWCNETWQICFVYWSFLVIMNKSSRICLNHFRDSMIQLLESGKTQESGLIPMFRQDKLADFFPVFSARLKVFLHETYHKWGLCTLFSQFYYHENDFDLQILAMYFHVLPLYMYKVSLLSSHRWKGYQWSKF